MEYRVPLDLIDNKLPLILSIVSFSVLSLSLSPYNPKHNLQPLPNKQVLPRNTQSLKTLSTLKITSIAIESKVCINQMNKSLPMNSLNNNHFPKGKSADLTLYLFFIYSHP
jgi:hypothetical protein